MQQENQGLSQKVAFYQRELQTLKSEMQGLQLEADQQYRQSVIKMNDTLKSNTEIVELQSSIEDLK